MNYTQDIAPLETAGLTDSQIADILSSVTVKPVPLWAFENFLDEQGLGYRDLSGKWRGTLPDAVSLPDPLGPGVTVLFSHVNKLRAEQIDTTQQPWCLMAAELLAGLIQAEIITEQHREGFYALGGGLKHGPMTAQDIEAARDQHAIDQARQASVDSITTRCNEAMSAASAAYDAGQTSEQITAAAEAAWAGE